jgi:hypothetical protein
MLSTLVLWPFCPLGAAQVMAHGTAARVRATTEARALECSLTGTTRAAPGPRWQR